MTLLSAGFTNPVFDSQAVFRSCLSAQSYVGQPQTVLPDFSCPTAIMPATAAMALTLLDFETPVAMLGFPPAVVDWIVFHTQAPVVPMAQASFVLVSQDTPLPDMAACHLGNDLYPEQGATIIKEVINFSDGEPLLLSGPGLLEPLTLRLPLADNGFVRQRMANYLRFPSGVDLFFCSGQQLLALPRSTKVEQI